jgi:hypothetical protein
MQSGSIVSGLFEGSYMFQFNESANTMNTAWTALGNSTVTPLSVNKGYRLYYPLSNGITYNHEGLLNNGTFQVPVDFTDDTHGFNLVPNPYPSAINWVQDGHAHHWQVQYGHGNRTPAIMLLMLKELQPIQEHLTYLPGNRFLSKPHPTNPFR